jgi:hypothetical protein
VDRQDVCGGLIVQERTRQTTRKIIDRILVNDGYSLVMAPRELIKNILALISDSEEILPKHLHADADVVH